MSYKILSEDLKKDRKISKKRSYSKKPNLKKIHILIILILLGTFFTYLYNPLNFLHLLDNDSSKVVIKGDLTNFSTNYSGDILIKTDKFFLFSSLGKFNGSNSQIKIINFKGKIINLNNTIIFNGSSDKIIYNENSLNMKDKNFRLTLFDNSVFNYSFINHTLLFKKCNLHIENVLNYKFQNGTIFMNNFKGSIMYKDHNFKFFGNLSKLTLKTTNPNLLISYNSKN